MNAFRDAIIGACLMGAIIALDEMAGLGLGGWGRFVVFLPLLIAIHAACASHVGGDNNDK